jgi:hypothetical protein
VTQDAVRIVETSTFIKASQALLSDHELVGLRYFLANNPLAGNESHYDPRILVLDWRGDGTVLITYVVSQQLDELLLIAIISGEDEAGPDTEISRLLDLLTKTGIGYGIKWLLEQIFG